MNSSETRRPPLQVYQSLWSMQPHSPDGVKLPLNEVCDMVAAEGFVGMAIDLGAADVKTAYDVRPHLLQLAGIRRCQGRARRRRRRPVRHCRRAMTGESVPRTPFRGPA